MRIIFAGTPEFAEAALERLIGAGVEVALVVTQPDRPAGRGMHPRESAVKQLARRAGIEVAQPVSLRKDPLAVMQLRRTPHDLMVVAAYGLILPQEVLDIAPYGCLNIHASLLPRWRGAAPIQRAIAAGDSRTGVCIMRMDAGLDTGPVLLSRAIPIGARDTAATLHASLAALGGAMIVEALGQFDQLVAVPQPEQGVTYAAKIDKAESVLDFNQPAMVLDRKIRAFDPFPGASARHGEHALKIWSAYPGTGAGGDPPGTVLSADGDGIVVACNNAETLVMTELQRPGARRMPVREFLRGFPLAPGSRFAE